MPRKYTLSRKGADKHVLYQWAVQDAEQEIELSIQQFEKRRSHLPRILREDFCGTALVSASWVKGHPDRSAIGLDLDRETLEWAEDHNLQPLGEDRQRVDLRHCDVRTVTDPKADIVQAFNFSYCLLHSSTELIDYFRKVRLSLAPGGIFLLDSYGGWDNQQLQKRRRKVKTPDGSFGFIWETATFNPIDNRTECHIHFEFKNSKRWKRAFTYDFRLYSIPELRESLAAAGFTNIEVLWDFEGDEEAECDYRPTTEAENCPSWIAYIVAEGDPTQVEAESA